jgi:hypothetical protein
MMDGSAVGGGGWSGGLWARPGLNIKNIKVKEIPIISMDL